MFNVPWGSRSPLVAAVDKEVRGGHDQVPAGLEHAARDLQVATLVRDMRYDLLRDDDVEVLFRQRHLVDISRHECDAGEHRFGSGYGLARQVDSRCRAELGELVREPSHATAHVEDGWPLDAEGTQIGQDFFPALMGLRQSSL